uniref:G-patch domain containing 3 n=1 Tax=Leptobrachium leishanense TaxID=445787 RepID=A0A8C5LNN1_9ANUR
MAPIVGLLTLPRWRRSSDFLLYQDGGYHMTYDVTISYWIMAAKGSPVLFLVSGIPRRFRSAQLRNYFSQFTESGGFTCFHFRHRPERRSEAPGTGGGTCCCPVTVRAERSRGFLRMYDGKPWLDAEGQQVSGRCLIRRVQEGPEEGPPDFPYKTRQELLGGRPEGDQHVTVTELRSLCELNPPMLMPQGNIGTPTQYFLQQIRSCQLPPRLIRRLGLQFPSKGRLYSRVPFMYNGTNTVNGKEGVYTARGQEITEGVKLQASTSPDVDPEGRSSSNDNDTCEEWERHEALHEDVTMQERSKERLYEEKIELKWEKGGSGLVFYTDAQLWQEEEGDFDEQTADDWDVDMSGYYDPEAGDKDARDCLKMRLEKRRRDGLDDAEYTGFGGFEQHTKGIGRRLMERQGWKEGTGLGACGAGMPEALENDGQNPKCKRGLGLICFCGPVGLPSFRTPVGFQFCD